MKKIIILVCAIILLASCDADKPTMNWVSANNLTLVDYPMECVSISLRGRYAKYKFRDHWDREIILYDHIGKFEVGDKVELVKK